MAGGINGVAGLEGMNTQQLRDGFTGLGNEGPQGVGQNEAKLDPSQRELIGEMNQKAAMEAAQEIARLQVPEESLDDLADITQGQKPEQTVQASDAIAQAPAPAAQVTEQAPQAATPVVNVQTGMIPQYETDVHINDADPKDVGIVM